MVKASLFAAWNQCLLVKIHQNPMFVVKSTPPCLTAYCSSQPSLRLKPHSNHHASKIVHQRMARLARLEPKGHAGMGVKFSTSRPTKCYSTALVDFDSPTSFCFCHKHGAFVLDKVCLGLKIFFSRALVIGAPYGETWQSHLTFHDTVGPLEIRTYDINTWFRCLGIRYGNIM